MIEIVEIDKKFILSRLSQEEIFARYLGYEVDYCGKHHAVLREDPNPTCTFKKFPDGVIWFKDWSGHFQGDCFNLVQTMYGVKFYKACKIIAQDFGLITGMDTHDRKPKEYVEQAKGESHLAVKWREYEYNDVTYWKHHGILPTTLETYVVGCIQYGWSNGNLMYIHKGYDPGYAYMFGDKMKMYFPNRDSYRFVGNYKGLQGYDQLPPSGELLIVTKSLKDVMFMHQMGIAAVAPASESSILTEEEFTDLYNRFDRIICIYDFDLTGVRSANKMRKLYGIECKFFTNGRFGTRKYTGKDLTDIAKASGSDVAQQQLLELCGEQQKT